MRTIILHYHLFKNAGTSLDAALKENFSEEKGEWVTKEFSNNPNENREKVTEWILNNPKAKCFSSHTALLHDFNIEGIRVIPVIFIRNAIDRIYSAYKFEVNHDSNDWGSALARNTTFRGYVETRLAMLWDRQCRNFHLSRFSSLIDIDFGSESQRAVKAVEMLPFVGVVEKFSESLEKLELLLKESGFQSVSLSAKKLNITNQESKDLNQKMMIIKDALGDDLYEKLVEVNMDDMNLYNVVSRYYS